MKNLNGKDLLFKAAVKISFEVPAYHDDCVANLRNIL